ncbi:MAG TPA: amidohydrolase [Salinimicrobium catena]|uniref:Amidohydrolase n=1 Tax=Salinimicrobium catena TaxID=390640 RepID=A0A7C2M9C8_9FLAO|nr:amidohydrolase [Salinimicrobium catena]
MKIDAHQHFWQFDPQKYSWVPEGIQRNFFPMDLEPLLRKNDFDGCIAVQADQSEEETVKLLEMANTYSYIKGVVGWVDLSAENVEERLELYSRDPAFKGVRHTVWDEKGEFMTAPAFQRGIAKLNNFKLTYDILAFDYQLDSAVELVKTFPDQKFVLDHLGKPPISEGISEAWKRNIIELANSGKVYCKISGLVTQVSDPSWNDSDLFPFLEVVTAAFGSDRLMFGSDWPVCLSAATYEEVLEVVEEFYRDFSGEEKEMIFGGNATRFYNLNPKLES